MRWLLWKDYRQNRLIVFTALFLLVVPHLVVLFVMGKWVVCNDPAAWGWPIFLGVSSTYSLILSQVAVALIGGNAIAGERVDRSAEFLFSLPITRRRLLASKLLLAAAIAAVPWVINVSVLWRLGEVLLQDRVTGVDRMLMYTAFTGMTFFCVAWLLSSLIASPTFAICGGLVAPLLFVTGLLLGSDLFVWRIDDETYEFWYRTYCLIVSLPLFALGTWLYLRRVEP